MHIVGWARLLGVTALLCAAAVAAEATGSVRTATPAPPSACPSAVRGLGQIAFVTRGGLQLVDLRSCQTRRLAARAAWSPQFSPDGRWLAYSRSAPDHSGSPVLVPAGGGAARSPLGSGIQTWWWAPHGATLYGATRAGQLRAATPRGRAHVVAGGARTFADAIAASPDGRRVVTDTSRCVPTGFALDTTAVANGTRRVALSRRNSVATFAGWSPDGRWLLYWAQGLCSASIAADGDSLDAAPVNGGHRASRAVAHMLLDPDFLTWCGGRLIAASTPSRETQLGSRLVATGPPAWHQRTIAPATHLSWVSPACAPSGTLLAAAAGPRTNDAGFGVQHRSIWLLTRGGAVVRQLTTPPASDLSDEAPRFSGGGRWILFVRTRVITAGLTAFSRDTLELVPAARSGPAAAVAVATFTSSDSSFYDHFNWPSEIAWSAAAG